MTHGVVCLEPDGGTGFHRGDPCLTCGVDEVKLVATELGIVDISELAVE
jgi:hypothetical protein